MRNPVQLEKTRALPNSFVTAFWPMFVVLDHQTGDRTGVMRPLSLFGKSLTTNQTRPILPSSGHTYQNSCRSSQLGQHLSVAED